MRFKFWGQIFDNYDEALRVYCITTFNDCFWYVKSGDINILNDFYVVMPGVTTAKEAAQRLSSFGVSEEHLEPFVVPVKILKALMRQVFAKKTLDKYIYAFYDEDKYLVCLSQEYCKPENLITVTDASLFGVDIYYVECHDSLTPFQYVAVKSNDKLKVKCLIEQIFGRQYYFLNNYSCGLRYTYTKITFTDTDIINYMTNYTPHLGISFIKDLVYLNDKGT